MSTEIKPGQIWAWKNGDRFTIDPDIIGIFAETLGIEVAR